MTPRAAERRDGAPDRGLPNATPRPAGEFEQLKRAWAAPKGIQFITAVNNTYVGVWYVGAALLFFVLAGVLALIMRTQLAVPDNDLLDQDLYNQLFTTHGTTMMFLFAVPAVEAASVYLLPNVQAARDLPFPRLSAYAFWAYFLGGLAFFCSIFFGLAPKGGWFMYPPLTSYVYSPGLNADLWLLGIGFIEISAIAGAIEIIVGVLRTRAPGMSLDKMPVYSWAMLVFAGMVIFAFPSIILCTALLELERTFHWPFFVAEKGGDPLLWQHLFWFFGHPEVYVIFLPATGMMSMMVPTMAQAPLVGYRLVVVALIATGFLSFGLWVHHMFATGLPQLSLSFFSAASMGVAVPSGIQIFAWIATIARGRLKVNAPTLFILGFFFIFVIGGLTGVMVAMVPFDWQVHDTYFVVAHFHYVLIGGMVFPLFAAIYYWVPTLSPRLLSDRLGCWVFGFLFVGVNVAFFPMHITGLMGMPRRVYTYPAGLGWDVLNQISTAGAYLIAIGVAIFAFDLVWKFRAERAVKDVGNVWNGGTLEWLPSGNYQTRSIPIVTSRYPLWDQPNLADDVEAGRYYLPGAPTGGRETIITSPVDARPQYILQIPGPSWPMLLAAVSTAAFFYLLTFKVVIAALVCGALTIALILWWMWDTDPGPNHEPIDIGGGVVLPVYVSGPTSHSWWAVVVLLLAGGTLFVLLLFAYFFLWLVNPQAWPPAGISLRPLGWTAGAAALYLAGSACIWAANRSLAGSGDSRWPLRLAMLAAVPLMSAGLLVDIYGYWTTGLRPDASSYAAVVYTVAALQGLYVFTLIIMGLYVVARSLAGKLDPVRRVTFDNTRLIWHYATGQGIVGLAVVHAFPQFIG